MSRLAALATAVVVLAYAHVAYALNPIQVENAKPGTADWMLYSDAVSSEIEGYASRISVAHGESISFFVSTIDTAYTMNIYRMGWYDGLGARKVHGPVSRTGFLQAVPSPDPVTGIVECHWTDPYTITIPSDWTSGVYLVKLSIQNPRKDQYIPFIVRDDASSANHYFQLSVTTWQAYNNWGGKSLYSVSSTNNVGADKVSFDRPFKDGSGTGQFLWRWEYNMVRFLEREGYDLTYGTNLDVHERGQLLQNHESFLSVGHDEYWSWEMLQAVIGARDAGIDLAFFSANTAYWQVRFEPSAKGSANRTMVSYKEDALAKDPLAKDGTTSNDHLVTTKFRDAPVNRPESALIGVQYVANPVDGDIEIDDVTSAPWVFENTGLTRGSKLRGLLGYEVDAMTPFTPPNTIRLGYSHYVTTSSTPKQGYSDMTLYTAPSGAEVFATGSIQWAWGLDDWNSSSRGSRLNPAAQQMTRNLLRRFADGNAADDCQYTLSPISETTAPAAGSGTIELTTDSECAWTVTSNAPWLTLTSAATGTGSSQIGYAYTTNDTGVTRTATLTIADKTFTVTQRGCAYSLQPSTATIPAAGATITVNVNTDAGCAWTAVSNHPWIIVTSGFSGAGSGTVTLQIQSTNGGPGRTGSVTIGGVVMPIQQVSGCAYSFTPEYGSFGRREATGSITVTSTSPDCRYTATSASDWITITGGASGSGTGTITYAIAENIGASRDGIIWINGTQYNIHQSSGCRYTVSTTTVAMPAGGGPASVDIATHSTCFWASSSRDAWIVITSGANGNGNGTTTFTVQPNTTGTTRTGQLVIAGNSVVVTQTADSCLYELTPATANHGAGASSGSFVVRPSGNCSWSAVVENGGSFLSITSGGNGTGVATVTYALTQNTFGAARTGTIRVGGQTFTVTQSAANFTPIALTATANGTTNIGLTWTAVSGATAYEILRGDTIDALAIVGTSATPSYTDSSIVAGRAYVYRVRAHSGGTILTYSNTDVATAIAFTDPTITPRVTVVRAAHILELRQAVNAVRAAAGLGPFAFADPSPLLIRALHIQQLRAALDEARAILGLPTMAWTDPTLTVIRAVHITELRSGVM